MRVGEERFEYQLKAELRDLLLRLCTLLHPVPRRKMGIHLEQRRRRVAALAGEAGAGRRQGARLDLVHRTTPTEESARRPQSKRPDPVEVRAAAPLLYEVAELHRLLAATSLRARVVIRPLIATHRRVDLAELRVLLEKLPHGRRPVARIGTHADCVERRAHLPIRR